MHPSEAILSDRSNRLKGETIVVGITGSIAAVESIKVIRELLRHGAKVVPVMSRDATSIVTPGAIEFAAGIPPVVDITGQVEHVKYVGPGAGKASLMLIAPATSNTLSKIALGISDTSVTTFASMALGAGIPIVVAPAMHSEMTRNRLVNANLDSLRKAGVHFVPPVLEENEAKLAHPDAIVAHVMHHLGRGPLKGRSVLVIGGSTAEHIDDVRYVTNGGSGRTAVELASWAFRLGATPVLWLGEARVPVPEFIPTRRFRDLSDLNDLMERFPGELKGADLVLVPAALSDYTVEGRRKGKIDSATEATVNLRLARTRKVLPEIRGRLSPNAKLVGFKLAPFDTPEDLAARARTLMQEVGLDAVVANGPSAMGAEESMVLLVLPSAKPLAMEGPKSQLALRLMEHFGELLP